MPELFEELVELEDDDEESGLEDLLGVTTRGVDERVEEGGEDDLLELELERLLELEEDFEDPLCPKLSGIDHEIVNIIAKTDKIA